MPRQERPKSGSRKPKPSVPVTAKRERKKREGQSNAEQPQAAFHDPNATQIKYATVVIAVATCVMVGVSALQWSVLQKTLEADHRPWLTIKGKPATPMVFFVGDTGLLMGIDFEISNVGKTPATNVFFHGVSYIEWKSEPSNKRRSEAAKQTETCAKNIIPGSNAGGYVILPGDTFVQRHVVRLPRADVRKSMDEGKNILPAMFYCVAYTFGYSEQIHRTAILITIGKIYDWTRDYAFRIDPKDGTVPIESIKLQRVWSYIGDYAD